MTTDPQVPAPTAAQLSPERVKRLLDGADTPESWYYQPGWGLQKHNQEGLGLIAGQSDFATHGDLLLLEAAPVLARTCLALQSQVSRLQQLVAEALTEIEELAPDVSPSGDSCLEALNTKLLGMKAAGGEQ